MLIRRFLVLFLSIFLFSLTLGLATAEQNDVQSAGFAEAMRFLDHGGFAVMKRGHVIAAHNLHTKLVPASILKIATSLAALQVLGPQYRFETDFFIDAKKNLYIKGFGDPFLISEEVAGIVRELKRRGCSRIHNIYLDQTSFDISTQADGEGGSDNPYDAWNSGLAVNFNTVNINKDTSGGVFSAEEQTPTMPLMAELAKGLEPGIHRINITMDGNTDRNIISRYAGELFRAYFLKENIPVEGKIAPGRTPETLTPYYRYKSSKTLKDIIPSLMRYSNNFIANQLYLVIGAKQYGHPATWEKSRKATAEILQKEFHLPAGEITLFEGSGLSRKNLVTPYAMLQLLDSFKPYYSLMPEKKDGTFVKSGTLTGVYSYAGYFTEGDVVDSFVIILNQERNNRDRLLLQLKKIYRGNR